MAASKKDREEILQEAREIQDSARRDAYLREACGADPDLRAWVETLLTAYDRADNLPSTKEPWRDLYNAVQERRTTLEGWNNLHVKIYKHLGYFLSVSIPLLAALVTYLSAASSDFLSSYASVTGLILTFLTVLNEVLKPGQRFLGAVQLSHDLEEFKTDVEVELRGLSRRAPQELDKIYAELQRYNRHLSGIGEAMARGTLSPKAED